MKCDFNKIVGLLIGAIALLMAAIVVARLWPYPGELLIAAAMVAAVSVAFTLIKSALAACPRTCNVSNVVNDLGQAASILAAIPFLAAGLLQIKALALLVVPILNVLGLAVEAVVGLAVIAGTVSCIIVAGILLGVLLQVLLDKPCFG